MKGSSGIPGRVLKQSLLNCILFFGMVLNADAQYLKRSLTDIREVNSDFTTASAHYMPVFGEGDNSPDLIKGIERYGQLLVDAGGISNQIKKPGAEHIVFVLDGTGIINYGKEKLPVTGNDIIYIPEGKKFSFSNPRDQKLSVIVMAFRIFPDGSKKCAKNIMIANSDEVIFQTLPSHGPTTTFQLLLGTAESTRDRLAAACQVSSLFIMDFASGGTNNPHTHASEEEIYLVLRGYGDMVAGKRDDGTEFRHPSVEGDVYFFAPNTLIGFYSGCSEDEEHSRILAVRFKYP